MKQIIAVASGIAVVWCAPARAGEDVLYGAAPEWVVAAELPEASTPQSPLLLLDKQVRLEGGAVVAYSDVALRIESPDALTALGTIKLGWLPDKGDLRVHRLEIVRAGATIDLLADGVRYEVLRRERQLERRSLDGALTATLAVPGLKVGDVLRYSQTVSLRDQALGDKVQELDGLMTGPDKIGFGRMIYSWPEGEEMRWLAGPGVTLPEPERRGGYNVLTIPLPLPERAELPEDTPARFTMAPMIQIGSFAGWTDVSATMAPHYETAGTIARGGPLAAEVARIERQSNDPLVRAALALEVVQDQVSYLLNGMAGGNYLPQSPALTWELRYGDCKAKSLLLLAMLREMGIEADATLVRSSDGDMLAAMLPLPGAFDHVIVRARIDGKDYWLDGTGSGTRLDTIDEVPDVRYALPLRLEGADLAAVEQRRPTSLDRVLRVTYDYGAGIDMPAVYEVDIEARGIIGARIRAQVAETDRQKRIEYVEEYLKPLVGDGYVYDAEVAYDEAAGIGRIKAKGLLYSPWEFERDRGKLEVDLPSTDFEFNPDRARATWRALPYNVDGPLGLRDEITVVLPDAAEIYSLAGRGTLEEDVARVHVSRSASLAGNRLHIVDESVKLPGEIAPAEIAGEKARAARLRSGDPVLRASAEAARYWQHADAGTERLAGLERAYGAIIEVAPDEAWRWALRGGIREYYPDNEGALADYARAIELEPTAERYASRASLLRNMGRIDEAIEDAAIAFELDPTLDHATALANLDAERGAFDDALAVLDDFDLSGDDRITLLKTKASVLGEAGRLDEGWALLEEALAERPGDADVLDSQCWYMGNWSYALDRALETCDRAVRQSDYAVSPLDSRALVQYRLHKSDAALDDLRAALASDPGYGTSLYLRGVIRLEQGDAQGDQDIAQALRVWGSVGRLFSRFGIKPAS
jgi:tetratricopeptide (TPR) repeat protein/transglutaminase-like putative cysteine protease